MFPVIPTRVHGVLDYMVGLTLMALPFILGFGGNNAATWIMVLGGSATIVYSLCTDYELGLAPLIPMRGHLAIDAVMGAFMVVSPWVLGFADYVAAPHVIAGLTELAAVALSSSKPAHGPRHARRQARRDAAIDEAGRESFPASDPPAHSITR